MENHLNGNTSSPEHTEDVPPRIEAMLLQTNTWLRQIATRLDALEAPAVINNAQIPIDHTQQLQNDNRITAVKARMSALFVHCCPSTWFIKLMCLRMMNMERRTHNANWYRAMRTPYTRLLPLIDLRTGEVINGFPGTVADLSRLNGKYLSCVSFNDKKLILNRKRGKKYSGRARNPSPRIRWR